MLRHPRLLELWRYGQVGLVNALFGFAAYALLVRLGLNIFAAQIVATVLGVAFNFFTYSRHVFRESSAGMGRFLLAYAGNYLVSLAILSVARLFIASPYLIGAVAIIGAAAVNYAVLRYLVFVRPAR